jgi:RNA polymerase sigma factor (TIGR02999 family)
VPATSEDITELLQKSAAGDSAAHARLLPLIYDELRVLGRAQRRSAPNQTLNTTALVHEAYLKLADRMELSWPDRRCFYAYAAKAMRNILHDNARRRAAVKHGAGAVRVEAELDELPLAAEAVDLIAVDQALTQLGAVSPRLAEVVELHVFAGLGFAEIASCLELTERTVFRDWRKARALLGQALG